MTDTSTYEMDTPIENPDGTLDISDGRVRWYREDPKHIELELSTDFENGLSEKRVNELQERYGKNVIEEDIGPGFLARLVTQIKSPLVFVLLIAGLFAFGLGALLDAIVIFIALAINIAIGLVQEGRASKAFEKLNASQEKYTFVWRDGKKKRVLAEDIVVGDIIVLESGMQVPADVRILEENDLEINEASLTGEWVSVPKEAKTLEKDIPLAERANMAWKSTLISTGAGRGVAVEIGSDTEIGRIAEGLQKETDVVTPIQRNIARIARFLTVIIIAVSAAILVLGILRGLPLTEMVLMAIAIIVSVVPEGLPAAVTVVLAIGMEKILKRGGLVKNLLAAETLGSTTIILTDKTGTLTQSKMELTAIHTHDSVIRADDATEEDLSHSDVLRMAVLTSDAFVEEDPEEAGKLVVHGRPIEKAILSAGLEKGFSQRELNKEEVEVDFLPFSSENRFAASLRSPVDRKMNRLYISGAPEFLLDVSSRYYSGGHMRHMDGEAEARFREVLEKESRKGRRLIALTFKDVKFDRMPRSKRGEPDIRVAENLVFAGLLVFEDPIREDVHESMALARSAGARVIMLTGDNPNTAITIARQAGIATENNTAVLGDELKNYSDDELYDLLMREKVFARVLPDHKFRIAKVLRNKKEVVAMTGDGINDAPALRNADIGVATGSGTEVAKEASDLVLLDDSFSIIIAAIEEGRRIIDNLKKIVTHLISTSFGEVFLIGGAMIAGTGLPILVAQLLWVNIIEGGLLNFAFAFEPAEKDVMKRNPRSAEHSMLLTKSVKKLILTIGITTGIFTLALFLILHSLGVPIEELRTIMFITLSFDAIFFIFSLKDFHRPLWKINPLNNKFLILSVFMSAVLLIGALTVPVLKTLLQIAPLTPVEVLLLAGVGVFNLATIEIAKFLIFRKERRA